MPLSLRDVVSLSLSQVGDEEIISLGLLSHSQLSFNWNTASGGEKKRTLLTQILLKSPRLILLDEPFNHLDKESHELIGHCLHEFVQRKTGALILVSHESQSENLFSDVPIKRVEL